MKEPKLIRVNATNAQIEKQSWADAKQRIQKLLDIYPEGLPPLESSDFTAIFEHKDNFLFKKITGDSHAHLAIGAGENQRFMKIDQTAAMALFVKPDGWQLFVDEIDLTIRDLQTGFGVASGGAPVKLAFNEIDEEFCIDADGLLQYSESRQKKLDVAGHMYIRSEGGHAIVSFIEDVWESYTKNGIQSLVPGRKLAEIIDEIMTVSYVEKKYSIAGSVFAKDADFLFKEQQREVGK